MPYEPPQWIKLDHSANIYPATLSRRLAAMFRLSVTLNEVVDPSCLQTALEQTIRRIPLFQYRLKQGVFWFFLEKQEGCPAVQPDAVNPLISIKARDEGHFLFRIRYYACNIALETFHALTDGTGALTFLVTLTAAYMRIRYKTVIPSGKFILPMDEPPHPEEMEDSFHHFIGSWGIIRAEQSAYHAKGQQLPLHQLYILTGKIPIATLKGKCAQYGCTVTTFLAALMIETLQQQQARERKRKPLMVSVPVNLRAFFPSATLRNFASWVNIGIDPRLGHYTLEEIINSLQAQMKLSLNEKALQAKMSGTMRAAQNPVFRVLPSPVKRVILNLGDRLLGDSCCSQSLSNLGNISLPDSMQPYVRELRFILGRSRGKAGSGSCISLNGNLYLTFSRKIREAEFERLFFSRLVEMDIPVEIESNYGR